MADDIYADEELFRIYGKKNKEKVSLQQRTLQKLKASTNCSKKRCKRIITSTIPILHWLPRYKIKDFPGDIVGGLTVGVVHIPQGLAYSLLAGLPPINGLYVSFFPVLMYVLFGTTRQLSIGTFAVISLMVGAVLDKNVPTFCDVMAQQSAFSSSRGSGDRATLFANESSTFLSTTPADCEKQTEIRKIEVAIGLSIAVAILHFAMYILRLGIVTVYFSSHMVSGYTCGAAFHVLTSQVSKLLGLDIPRRSGVLALVYTYIDIFDHLYASNWVTVLLSFGCILLLFVGKEINIRYKPKLPFPLPWELALVILCTIASALAEFNLTHNVEIVGEIPQGVRTSVPKADDIGLVITDAIPVAIVIYSVSVSLSRLLSEKHNYEFDANQELLAYAIANTFGAFFQCFPSGSSLSRSIIWDEIGGNTQLTGLISTAVVLVVLLWIGPMFEKLPQATLAAIIVVNLKRLLTQFDQLKPLWKVSKLDAATWLVAWLAVVLLGVDLGLYVAVGFSLFTVVLRTQSISGSTLVPVGDTGVYKNTKQYFGEIDNSTLIFKFPAPLIYANQERFRSQLYISLGFKPTIEIKRRQKKRKQSILVNSNHRKHNDHADEDESVHSHSTDEHTPETRGSANRSKFPQQDMQLSENESSPELESAFRSQIRTGSLATDSASAGKTLNRVILDMSQCSFIDNDGVKTLLAVFKELSKLDIDLALAHCSDNTRRILLAGNFPNQNNDSKPIFFVSLEKAIHSYKSNKNISSDEDSTAVRDIVLEVPNVHASSINTWL